MDPTGSTGLLPAADGMSMRAQLWHISTPSYASRGQCDHLSRAINTWYVHSWKRGEYTSAGEVSAPRGHTE